MSVRVLSGDDVRAALQDARLHRGHGRRTAAVRGRRAVPAAALGRAAAAVDGARGPDDRAPGRATRPPFGLKAVGDLPGQSEPRARRAPGRRDRLQRRGRPACGGSSTPRPLTAIRTAAVSAVATRALAREGRHHPRGAGRGRAGRGAHRVDGLRHADRARAYLLPPPRARRSSSRPPRPSATAWTPVPRRPSRKHCAKPPWW